MSVWERKRVFTASQESLNPQAKGLACFRYGVRHEHDYRWRFDADLRVSSEDFSSLSPTCRSVTLAQKVIFGGGFGLPFFTP